MYKRQNTTEIYIEEEDTVESRIADCISQGIKIFVGDNIVCRTAEKFGCKSYLITSTKDSIPVSYTHLDVYKRQV